MSQSEHNIYINPAEECTMKMSSPLGILISEGAGTVS